MAFIIIIIITAGTNNNYLERYKDAHKHIHLTNVFTFSNKEPQKNSSTTNPVETAIIIILSKCGIHE